MLSIPILQYSYISSLLPFWLSCAIYIVLVIFFPLSSLFSFLSQFTTTFPHSKSLENLKKNTDRHFLTTR